MKTNFPRIVFAGLVILFSTFAANATDGLVLTGSVTEVTPVYRDKGRYYFKIDLILQFRNDSNEPFIILSPDRFQGTKRLVFIKDYSSNSAAAEIEGITPEPPDPLNTWLRKRGLPERDRTEDYIRSLLTEMQSNEPSGPSFATIQPYGYFEYRESLLVNNGFKIKELPDKNPRNPPRLVAVSEFAGMKVEYRVSIGKRPYGIDLMNSAKLNWESFGNLIFDADGNYSVKSDLILNMLPN